MIVESAEASGHYSARFEWTCAHFDMRVDNAQTLDVS